MLLEKLSNAVAPSGYEGEIREIILSEIKPYVDEVNVDRMGNIIVRKNGKGKKVLIDAHMDEEGFIITAFNEDGTLKFDTLGNVNNRSIPSRTVFVGRNKIHGVIGLKPIHLQSHKERNMNIKCNECCIDIGAKSKKEAKEYVKLGDYAVCDVKFGSLGKNMLKGKAFDGRVGCAVLIDILKEEFDCNLYATFTVQKNVGLRGAYVAAYNVNPDIVLELNVAVSDDRPDIPNHLMSTEIGKGPAISLVNKNCVGNYELIEKIVNTAKTSKIPYQFITTMIDNNNSIAYETSADSCDIVNISVPCRYIHSSISVVSNSDLKNTRKLVVNFLKKLK